MTTSDKLKEIARLLEIAHPRERGRYAFFEPADISRQNVRNWLNGREPEDIATVDFMLAVLQGKKALTDPRSPVSGGPGRVRNAGTVPCGDWSDPLAADDFFNVNDVRFEGPRNFAAKVIGYSCAPALVPEDMTIWRQDHNPPYGSLVIAEREDDHACTVKVLAFDRTRGVNVLLPVNPEYDGPDDSVKWTATAQLIGVIRNINGVDMSFFAEDGLSVKFLMKLPLPTDF